MDTLKNQRRVYSIDLAKFICALFIIGIHTLSRENTIGIAFIAIARVAVPFFFVCSGYFYYDKIAVKDSTVKKAAFRKSFLRITIIYLLWSAIYLIFDRNQFFNASYSAQFIIFKFVKYIFFIGIHSHLWYLLALMACYIIAYLFFRVKHNMRLSVFLYVSILLYMFVAFGDMYSILINNQTINKVYEIYNLFFGETWNSFMCGLVFFGIGMMMKKNKYKELHKSHFDTFFSLDYQKATIISSMGIMTLIIETFVMLFYFSAKDNNLSLLLPIIVPMIFSLVLKLPEKYYRFIPLNIIDRMGKISLGMYLIHPLVKLLLLKLPIRFGVFNNSGLLFLATSVISIICADLYYFSKDVFLKRGSNEVQV